MSYHLIDVVQRLGHPRILVLGDLILDRYVWGDAERVSQEAPVILLREERQELRLGGAANVAHMLRGLEAEAIMAGVVGNDSDGRGLRAELHAAGVDCSAVVDDPSRPTTVKVRFIGRAQGRHAHQMLRVDREVRTPVAAGIAGRMNDALQARLAECQAVLVSDYGKGVCTPELVAAVIHAARSAGLPVIVDPSSSGDCRNFVDATAVTPNRTEAGRATGRSIRTRDDAFAAGRRLCAQFNLAHVFVTLDSDGMVLVKADGASQHFATRKREVYDITGAGDMVLATIGVGAAASVAPEDLARLANVAGGLEVEQIGVVPITRQQMLADLMAGGRRVQEKVCTLDEVSRHVAARRGAGQRIVFTNGCFDVLHIGHASYLQEAAREGDCLIVAVNSDRSVRQLNKGLDRPVFGETQRAAMLAALEAVDYVLVFDEATPHAVLECLKPDLLVKGGTYTREEIVGWELVESYGGQVKVLGAIPGVSTTQILDRLRGTGPSATIPHPSTQPQRKAG
ncbi:MAG TPA: bifunctional heptose 7-phosphate kinase/heptose 1-phosphate adenyltransferase [Planctomycetaceae bacterium]|nr:bifunctional heptose 7-phosphate kinase/heptose 1-phosphate adenyltransferase [Planctomycetaceae bacterium]